MIDYEKEEQEEQEESKEVFDDCWPDRPKVCPDCGSDNIRYQIATTTTYGAKKDGYDIAFGLEAIERWLFCDDCGWDGVNEWK